MSKPNHILLFGGTTEGKASANWLKDMGFSYIYSTKTPTAFQVHDGCVKHEGALSEDAMRQLCIENQVQFIINAAHPYANVLHWNINQCAKQLAIPHIRVERTQVPVSDKAIYLDTLDDLIEHCKNANYQKVVSLMGVKSVGTLHKNLPKKELWYRILDRKLSWDEALNCGVHRSRILASSQFDNLNDVKALIEIEQIGAILTKDSGYNGLFDQKVTLAETYNLPLVVLKQPDMPSFDELVKCRADLRQYLSRQMDLPKNDLAHGYTTGTCATICAKAAASLLLNGSCASYVSVFLPDGEAVAMPLHTKRKSADSAYATVIKNSGDDPDLTDGLVIGCRVYKNSNADIRFVIGEGVGTVQLPGLGLPIGEPAINKVPRAMIEGELKQLLVDEEANIGFDVEVFIPQGKRLAEKTFNPRLGVIGGLSIIGSTGRIKPFSSEAYVATILRQVGVVEENGATQVVLNSGGRSEAYLKNHFNSLAPYCFIQYGNYIGEALKAVDNKQVKKVYLGIMTGKAVKLAAGHLDTHSRKVVMDKQFIISIVKETAYGIEKVEEVETINMARELETIFPFKVDEPFFAVLKQKCEQVARSVIKSVELDVLLINNQGHFLQ